MIEQALRIIYDNCLQSCWLDCFGMLVTQHTQGEKSYPLSKDFECADCEEGEDYRLMVPDESKRSLAYFEQGGNLDASPSAINRDLFDMSVPVNLVVWWNIKKMGYPDKSIKDRVLLSMLKMIGNCECSVPSSSEIGNIRLQFNSQLEEDPFEKWNYDLSCLDIYPYEWLHLQFTLTFLADKSCFTDLQCLDEIC